MASISMASIGRQLRTGSEDVARMLSTHLSSRPDLSSPIKVDAPLTYMDGKSLLARKVNYRLFTFNAKILKTFAKPCLGKYSVGSVCIGRFIWKQRHSNAHCKCSGHAPIFTSEFTCLSQGTWHLIDTVQLTRNNSPWCTLYFLPFEIFRIQM